MSSVRFITWLCKVKHVSFPHRIKQRQGVKITSQKSRKASMSIQSARHSQNLVEIPAFATLQSPQAGKGVNTTQVALE